MPTSQQIETAAAVTPDQLHKNRLGGRHQIIQAYKEMLLGYFNETKKEGPRPDLAPTRAILVGVFRWTLNGELLIYEQHGLYQPGESLYMPRIKIEMGQSDDQGQRINFGSDTHPQRVPILINPLWDYARREVKRLSKVFELLTDQEARDALSRRAMEFNINASLLSEFSRPYTLPTGAELTNLTGWMARQVNPMQPVQPEALQAAQELLQNKPRALVLP